MRILAALGVASLIVLAVPGARRLVLATTAKAILVAASPSEPEVVDFESLDQISTVVASDDTVLTELGGDERRRPVALASVPLHVRQAVLAAEDATFYSHEGVDPTGIYRALLRRGRGRLEGGSTISQQLAKLNFTDGERTFTRKFKEVQYVRRLERTYTKDELLERYLNQVYFGERSYGIEAAARTYFGISAAELTVPQAAMLAGKIRSPEGLNPRRDPDAAVARRSQVLAAMRRRGWLSKAQYRDARVSPLVLAEPQPHPVPYAPHFVAFVEREAAALEELGPDKATRLTRLVTGGLRIETTLDRRAFDATTAAVRATLGDPSDPLTAMASVEPGTGAIRSLFGGLDFARSTFDVSSQGGRQPGSAFKPFVYLAALESQLDPRSTFDGRSDQVFPCYGPTPVSNYAGESADETIDLDAALARSVNVTFVEVGCMVGVDTVLDVAARAGVPRNATAPVPATFLGGLSRGVTALTMAEAYATFAAGGIHATPYSIRRIIDRDGEVLYEHESAPERVFDERLVAVLNASMMGVISNGTGTAARLDRPTAGKTGTTTDNIDAWFVGYVGQLSTAVWVGHEPPRPMTNVRGRSVTGGSFPARMFAEMMGQTLQSQPVRRFPVAPADGLGLTIRTTTTTSTSTTTPLAPPPTEPPTSTVPPAAPATSEPPETTTTTQAPTTTTQPTTTTTQPTTTTTAKKSP